MIVNLDSPRHQGANVDLNDTPEQAEYREKTKAWLKEHKDEAPPRQGGV